MPKAAAGARGEEARSCAVPGAAAFLCRGNLGSRAIVGAFQPRLLGVPEVTPAPRWKPSGTQPAHTSAQLSLHSEALCLQRL